MSQKKMVNRKIVIALAVLCIAALVGLNVSVYSYGQQNTELQDKDNQILNLQEELTKPELRCMEKSQSKGN